MVMKTFLRNFGIGNNKLFSKTCILVLSAYLFAANAMADNGPSLQHLKKNLAAGDDELKKIAHQEMLQNIFMVGGFAIVIAIAWFSTTIARKHKKKEVQVTRNQQLLKH